MTEKPQAPALERPLAPPTSLADQAVAAIRQAVRDGALQPGRLYSAYQIADYLGVSRSPVRDALMRLAEAGLVAFERNRGFRIVLPGPQDIAEVFHLRLLLEVPAARQAAAHPPAGLAAELRAELALMRSAAAAHDEPLFMRHDQRLHSLIMASAGNARLVSLVDSLRDITRLLGASTVDRSRDLDDIADEHLPILDAITAGDVAAAGQAMAHHVSHTGTLLVAQAAAEAGGEPIAGAPWLQVGAVPDVGCDGFAWLYPGTPRHSGTPRPGLDRPDPETSPSGPGQWCS
jgi:DNA-binding GntR family transcriptional regulator